MVLAIGCIAMPVLLAQALDCGKPLAMPDCRDAASGAACGILYLQISNLVEDGPVLNGLSLARFLTRYSERGEKYVAAIRAMIRVNGLERLDDARLVRWPRPEA